MKASRNILVLTIAVILTGLACVFLGAWVWMGTTVFAERADLSHLLSEKKTLTEKDEYAVTLHALVRETTVPRVALQDVSSTPAVTIVQMIQDAAEAAGIEVSIDSIMPAFTDAGTVKKVPIVTLSISSQDSFAQLYKFLVLLEKVPLPLTIEQVSFENETLGKETKWTLRGRLSVFTEAIQ